MSGQKRILKELNTIWKTQELMHREHCNDWNKPCFYVHPGDLQTWHVTFWNRTNQDLPLERLHACVTFPNMYPLKPPKVKFFTMLPHPNLIEERDEDLETNATFCMPLLTASPGREFAGWSSGIQMAGLLTQIASMLFDKELLFCVSKISLDRAVADATEFRCTKCEACADPTDLICSRIQIESEGGASGEEVDQLPSVTRTLCYESRVPLPPRRFGNPSKRTNAWGTQNIVQGERFEGVRGMKNNNELEKTLPSPSNSLAVSEWTSVRKTTNRKLQMVPCHICERKLLLNFFSKEEQVIFLNKHVNPVCNMCKQLGHRHRGSRQTRKRSKIKKKALSKFSGNEMMHVFMFLGPKEACKMGTVSKLCAHLLNYPILWKQFVSRHLKVSKQIPRKFKAQPLDVDWKRLYALSVGNRIDHLRCFHTLQDFKHCVLGYPITYTVNPKTRQSDYILATPDVLSHSAFRDGVRTTIGNDRFDEFFPIFISKDHFKRGLPILKRFLAKLAEPNLHEPAFTPELILDVIPRMLQTIVVLLSNGGLPFTSRVLDTIISIFRVLVACVEEFPSLNDSAKLRLKKFMGHPMNRTKDVVPSLGTLWWLAAICPEVDIYAFSQKYFFESIDRSALWVLRESPLLERASSCKHMSPFVLEAWLKNRCAGSNRIHIIHWTIINLVCRPFGKPMADAIERYDWMLGGGTRSLHRKLQAKLGPVLTCTPESAPWSFFFKEVHFLDRSGNPPSNALLSSWLIQAMKNSAAKNYHTKGMDFSKVHRNGQSKILNKSQSCSLSCSGNIKVIDSWHWKGAQKYLDISLLFFDKNGMSRGDSTSTGSILDYRYRQLFRGAAQHSGDQIDDQEQRGTHSVDLRLNGLPKHIKFVYIVVSAWEGTNINDILLPSVACLDNDTGMEICRYSYRSTNSKSAKNIVMSRLSRPAVGAAWKFEAIGSEGVSGCADDYDPITKRICADLQQELSDNYVSSHPMNLFSYRTQMKPRGK